MKFRKIIAAALVVAMLLLLTSCGAPAETELTGEWKGTVDISQHLSQLSTVEIAENEITFDLIFIFGANGSFEAIVDQYSVKLMVEKLLDIVAEQLQETADEKGISKQELRKILESAVDTDALVASVQNSLQNGYYLYRDGVIYLSAEDNLAADPQKNAQEHLSVSVSGDTMVVQQITTDSYQHEQVLGGMLPLTFYKQ